MKMNWYTPANILFFSFCLFNIAAIKILKHTQKQLQQKLKITHKNAVLIVLSLKSVVVLIEDGVFAHHEAFGSSRQVSPPPAICHQRQKMLTLGVSWEEGGGGVGCN